MKSFFKWNCDRNSRSPVQRNYRLRTQFAFLLALISAIALVFLVSATPVPQGGGSPLQRPAVYPSSSASSPDLQAASSPLVSLTPSESKALLKEFMKAQKTEMKGVEHRFKVELKELKVSQDARLREWEKKEKEARYKYFSDHVRGPERRDYIQSFIGRREAFRKMLAEERSQRAHEQEIRSASIRQDQATRLKDFKKALEEGNRPAATLWPN